MEAFPGAADFPGPVLACCMPAREASATPARLFPLFSSDCHTVNMTEGLCQPIPTMLEGRHSGTELLPCSIMNRQTNRLWVCSVSGPGNSGTTNFLCLQELICVQAALLNLQTFQCYPTLHRLPYILYVVLGTLHSSYGWVGLGQMILKQTQFWLSVMVMNNLGLLISGQWRRHCRNDATVCKCT